MLRKTKKSLPALPTGRQAVRRGFTLIETLLAITVLIVGITGPLTIASHALQAALIAKDQTMAEYLAQDAIEYARYNRDSNCLGTNPSNCPGAVAFSTLSACMNNDCLIDTNPSVSAGNDIKVCGVLNACATPIKYDSTSGWFTYLSGTPSIYTRTLTVYSLTLNERQIRVTVTWNDASKQQHRVVVYENLYAWQ